MDLRSPTIAVLVVVLASSFWIQSKCEADGSVMFLDGTDHTYLRTERSGVANKIDAMTTNEIASTISVLLGFTPSSSLSTESSAKLNNVLLPNPFDKPHAVLVLEVRGIGAPPLMVSHPKSEVDSSVGYKVLGSESVEIELSDEDEISVVSIDEDSTCIACLDREFTDLSYLLGGSYDGSMELHSGELTFTLASGSSMKLYLSKQADLKFALGLVNLVRGVKNAVKTHQDLTGADRSTAELITGVFTGIEALKEYGSDASEKGLELLQTTLYNLFSQLQKEYKGKIVGVIVFTENSSTDSVSSLISLKYPARISRVLAQVGPSKSIIAQIVLVRTSIAWITGIIFLIATLMGVYLLFDMPLTRDTLLYCNVKLD
ncbi:Type 1 membrane protein-like [Zostera marina]|uniref:Type 1 membrane protein-like n=1 Tax=Zostera marina TaxID=29655 RepID=A0A0K9PAP2_ZOSMR|nr:Type 1 membrane protein-like [Zostera marina]